MELAGSQMPADTMTSMIRLQIMTVRDCDVTWTCDADDDELLHLD